MHRSESLRVSRLLTLLGLLALAMGGYALRGSAADAANTPGVSATFSPSTNVADCSVDSVAQPCTKNTVTATGFAPTTRVSLIQCPDANTIPDLCDQTTIDTGLGTGYFTDASGNFSSTVVPAYKVPTAADNILGNDPGFICDQTRSCVFLVIASTTFDFTQPHAYTNTFTLDSAVVIPTTTSSSSTLPPSSTSSISTSSSSSSTSSSSTSSSSSSTSSSSTSSSSTSSSSTSSSSTSSIPGGSVDGAGSGGGGTSGSSGGGAGTLARTGVPTRAWLLMLVGAGLLFLGTVVRRGALRPGQREEPPTS